MGIFLRPIIYEHIYFVIGVKATREELAQKKPLEEIIKALPKERYSYDEMLYPGEEDDFDDFMVELRETNDGFIAFNAIFTGLATVWFEQDETYSLTTEMENLVAFPVDLEEYLNYKNFSDNKEE